jgi:hypothetical protein
MENKGKPSGGRNENAPGEEEQQGNRQRHKATKQEKGLLNDPELNAGHDVDVEDEFDANRDTAGRGSGPER